jgi:hypothetical protein
VTGTSHLKLRRLRDRSSISPGHGIEQDPAADQPGQTLSAREDNRYDEGDDHDDGEVVIALDRERLECYLNGDGNRGHERADAQLRSERPSGEPRAGKRQTRAMDADVVCKRPLIRRSTKWR